MAKKGEKEGDQPEDKKAVRARIGAAVSADVEICANAIRVFIETAQRAGVSPDGAYLTMLDTAAHMSIHIFGDEPETFLKHCLAAYNYAKETPSPFTPPE